MTGYWRQRFTVSGGIARQSAYEAGLRRTLAHLLSARLAERHGINLYEDPAAARRLLCGNRRDDDLWYWIDWYWIDPRRPSEPAGPAAEQALLEAMGEGQVSVDGQTRRVPQPFVVLATDNPIEYEGTHELPEAQLDRFLMRLRLGHLAAADETAMLQRRLDRQIAVPALAHRVTLRPELWVRQVSADDVIARLMSAVPTPRTDPARPAGAAPAKR